MTNAITDDFRSSTRQGQIVRGVRRQPFFYSVETMSDTSAPGRAKTEKKQNENNTLPSAGLLTDMLGFTVLLIFGIGSYRNPD